MRERFADHWYETLSQHIKLFGPERAMKAVIPHIFSRATGNGVEYAEIERIALRLDSFEDWCAAWTASAQEKDQEAENAEREGRWETVKEAYLESSFLYHYGQLIVRPQNPDKLATRRLSIERYARGAPRFDPPAERVEIPYEGGTMPAYVRIPPNEHPVPGVLMLNGADSTKEELHYWADAIVRRGMAVLCLDGPGQGETAGSMTMPVTFETAASAAFDALARLPGVDADRLAIWGISTGGYLAARAAARIPRAKAAVSVGGFYDARWFPRWPYTTQENFCLMFGMVGRVGDMQDFVREHVTLAGLLHEVRCPFLILHGGKDHLMGMEEIQRMADEIVSSELVVFPDGDHALCNRHRAASRCYADWLASHLEA